MPKEVGFFLYGLFPSLSVASAAEALRSANEVGGRVLYNWSFYTLDGEIANSAAGLSVLPIGKLEDAHVDTLIVCATRSARQCYDQKIFSHLRRMSRMGTRIGGLSGGPTILARAGLLEGRRYTAHWEQWPALKEEFPHLDLRKTLFEIDGPYFTCAGGNAALDMMNVLIASDYGPTIAHHASDFLAQTHIREGEDSQRMSARHRFDVAHPILINAIQKLEERLENPLDRRNFASELGLSLRQIERLFDTHLGTSMNRYHLTLRLNRARYLIKQSSLSLTQVALATGFVNFSHFSRVYKNAFGYSPSQTRSGQNKDQSSAT